jgi:ADP-ribosylglycohydrolase
LSPADKDKAEGLLFGLAIGDALGAPTEFLSLVSIKAHYGPNGIQDLPDPARFTDDTQMSLAIAEALIQTGDQDIEAIMASVKHHFIQWAHSPENNWAPGRTCLNGIARMEEGMHWTRSGIARSKGCGSAMRSAPIGYLYQHDPHKLRQVAHATGICTHGHPTADAACIASAYLAKLVIDVLVEMGYGGSRKESGQAVGRRGDEGIDEIIKEDKLALDIIYVQAKRWGSTVGRPEIQKFAGALQGQGARKGIFITTSSFSADALNYVKNIDSKIILVDGQRLAGLMVEHNVGVSPIASYEIKRIDSDYFN